LAPSAGADSERRSDNERLVEKGIEGAEHDQMRQASLKRAVKPENNTPLAK
jgi:hypothetical protein